MAGGPAQPAQALSKRRDIGNRGSPRQPAHDLLRIGAERLDHIGEKSLLAAQLAQRLDAARIDDRHWFGGEPRMGGNRGYALAERCRLILRAGRPVCQFRLRRYHGERFGSQWQGM